MNEYVQYCVILGNVISKAGANKNKKFVSMVSMRVGDKREY